MDQQTIFQLLAAVSALSIIGASVWAARKSLQQLVPALVVYCLSIVLWAAGTLLHSLAAIFPALTALGPLAANSILIGQIVLVGTIFLLAFRGPKLQHADPGVLVTLVSLFAAAGLMAFFYISGSATDREPAFSSFFLPLAVVFSAASALRVLLTRQFWKRPVLVVLLIAAGAVSVFATQSLSTADGLPAVATHLLLVILAVAGAALVLVGEQVSLDQPRLTENEIEAPESMETPGLSVPEPEPKRPLLSAVISQMPEKLFGMATAQDDINGVLASLGKPLQAARVSLFLNETNAQGLLCLSLRESWAAAGVANQLDQPKLQRVPYSLCSLAGRENELSKGAAVSLDFRSPQSGDTLISPATRSILLLPVHANQRWVGLLTVEHFDRPFTWRQEEKNQLLSAAHLLGIAYTQTPPEDQQTSPDHSEIRHLLEDAHSRNQALEAQLANRENFEQEAKMRLEQLQALNATSNVLLSTLDLETLLGRVLDTVCQAIPGAEKGTLHIIAPDTGQLEMRAVLGFSDPRIHKHHSRARRGLLDTVINRKKPLLIADLEHIEELGENLQIGLEPDTRSVIAAPLIADQTVLGALYLAASRPNAFNENDLHLVSGFATTATLAIRNAQMHEKVQKMAITDQLTTLYNRRGFVEIGQRLFDSARRFHHSLAIISLDIDYFKNINDTYGHVSGDLVLQQLSEIVLRKIRRVDLVARLGGDEFTILLPETGVFQAMHVSERLRRRVETTRMQTGRGDVSITISLGVSRISTQTETLESLMDWADQALYDSKQAGRNRVRMFPLETPSPDLLPPDSQAN